MSVADNPALHLKPPAKLTQHWADYLDGLRTGTKVLPFKAA